MAIAERKARLLLVAASLLFVLLLLALGEVAIRLFAPEVRLLGTDRWLLRDPAYGRTYGWMPNSSGTSFSAPVHITNEGFRDLGTQAEGDSILLLIGDSVTFGVGVEAESTFAGLLQHAQRKYKVINSAAIGYSLEDYHEVLDHLLARDLNISRAIICYALNDFSRTISSKDDAPPLWNVRGAFRENSKLYIWLKATLFDRSEDYFTYDYNFYAEPSPDLPYALDLLGSLVGKLQARGIPVTVILIPYEYQLRHPESRYRIPQQILSHYLSTHHIPHIDTYPDFVADGAHSASYFLYADHMHLSPRGHRIVFQSIERTIPF